MGIHPVLIVWSSGGISPSALDGGGCSDSHPSSFILGERDRGIF